MISFDFNCLNRDIFSKELLFINLTKSTCCFFFRIFFTRGKVTVKNKNIDELKVQFRDIQSRHLVLDMETSWYPLSF